jgi:hypothetical protein
MSLFDQFETDPKLEREGILLDYGQNKHLPADPATGQRPSIMIRVARAGGSNDAFNKRIEILSKKHRRAIQNDALDAATLRDITKQAVVDTVILGWENVTDKDRQPLPFSRDNALKLFSHLPDLYMDIQEQAAKAALFRFAVREDDLKN